MSKTSFIRIMLAMALLLLASGIHVATTPVDDWTVFTLLSLLGGIAALGYMVYAIGQRNRPHRNQDQG